jgi:hypothetical protein
MGRGMGKLQREILDLVDGGPGPDGETPWFVADLTERIFGVGYADTQRRSVDRAVRSLAERDLVELYLTARWPRSDGMPLPELAVLSVERMVDAVMMHGASLPAPAPNEPERLEGWTT